jgi:NTP pyrophosphatase (non-canonical NTP hydrolase)
MCETNCGECTCSGQKEDDFDIIDNVKIVENGLTLNEYQEKTKSTAIYPNVGNNIYYPTLGLCGESGEVAEKVKKLMRDHGGILTDEYKAKIAKELGDALWYIAMTAYEIGYTLEDVGKGNNEKLASRKDRNVIQGNGDDR